MIIMIILYNPIDVIATNSYAQKFKTLDVKRFFVVAVAEIQKRPGIESYCGG